MNTAIEIPHEEEVVVSYNPCLLLCHAVALLALLLAVAAIILALYLEIRSTW